jgi:hypothetical protein
MMLRSIDWQLITKVSGQCIVQMSRCGAVFLEFLTLEDGTNKLSQNLGN